jgi:hypothetical protein
MATFDCSSCGAPLPDGTDILCATCSYEAAAMQTTTVTDWSTTPATDRTVPLPPRTKGRTHLSECLLFIDPSLHCTCDDFSPEWTI